MHITIYNSYTAGELYKLQSIIHILQVSYVYYNL